jgi:hypothetical protein
MCYATFVLHTKTPLLVSTQQRSTNGAIPAVTGFIGIVSPARRAPLPILSTDGLGSAAAPLPLLGARAPAVRVGLPPDNRA